MPAVAVIQGGQALFSFIRRKGHVGGLFNLHLEILGIKIQRRYACIIRLRIKQRLNEFLV